jgi:phosphoribosylformylglycinamidine synthase
MERILQTKRRMVEIMQSPSIMLQGMAGSTMPIAVAHGEGRASFSNPDKAAEALSNGLVSLRYIDNNGDATQHYPENPNGSEQAISGLCSTDGRFTIMMPHPERVIRSVTNSWHPDDWSEDSLKLCILRLLCEPGRPVHGQVEVVATIV